MTKTLIDAVHDCRGAMERAALRLESITDSMRYLGVMEPVQSKLVNISEMLRVEAKELSAAYSVDLGQQLSHSEAMAANLLKATLAGCIVPPKRATKEKNG